MMPFGYPGGGAAAAYYPPPMAPPTGASEASAPPAAASQLFAVTVPGRLMQLDWQAVGPARAIMNEDIASASEVPDVMVSMLPGSSLIAPDQAAVVYWSIDGVDWSLLGALSHATPSGMFRTGWGTLVAPGAAVRLAVSVEPLETARNLGLGASGEAVEDRKAFAAAIARDLWNFLTSFSQAVPGSVQASGGMMLVPTTVLDRWIERFNAKFARDPNFMLKASS